MIAIKYKNAVLFCKSVMKIAQGYCEVSRQAWLFVNMLQRDAEGAGCYLSRALGDTIKFSVGQAFYFASRFFWPLSEEDLSFDLELLREGKGLERALFGISRKVIDMADCRKPHSFCPMLVNDCASSSRLCLS